VRFQYFPHSDEKHDEAEEAKGHFFTAMKDISNLLETQLQHDGSFA
jgi:hypothetical protein